MKTFLISTLGCKVNQYESVALQTTLERFGLRPVEGPVADLIIINSCCITSSAARKSRHTIRQMTRQSPGATVAVVGCLSTYHESQVRQTLENLGLPPEKILIAGHHGDVARELEIMLAGGKCTKTHAEEEKTPQNIKTRRLRTIESAPPATQGLDPIRKFPEHQRAFVKVQDGCDAMCSYCVVPFTRARLWSRGVDEILDECRTLISAGYHEIVLCGVFIGAFGRTTAIRRNWPVEKSPLVELLYKVSQLEGLWRVRMGSIEPLDVTDELLAIAAENEKIAPHFHMPLQSGSEKILKLMNRQYTPHDFLTATDRLRDALSNKPAITTDIIVGFPSEDDDDFEQTLDVARYAGFSKIHAFPFSAIEPTPAWHKRHSAPQLQIVQKRIEQLEEVERETAEKYREMFFDMSLAAIVENCAGPAGYKYQAMTDRYLTVAFNHDTYVSPGSLVELEITGQYKDCLTGKFVKPL